MRKWRALALVAVAAAAAWWLWPRAELSDLAVAERALPTGQRAADSLSARIISDEDLPPEGTRSLFDHLLAQNDGLPYPFEKLIELIARQNPSGEMPRVLMIPDGRSLLKASADFHRPRVLVAADFHAPNSEASLGFAPRGQLFLGFVEGANEIEVLSYNEAAGRFEFQLVQDYRADGARRIVYAKRQICTTCHQGGGPIFPQRPWSETNGQPETAAQISAARGGEPYLGLPLANPLDVPERFDELTDVGSFLPVTQRLWLDACGENGADCRRQMLKLALQYLWNPAEFDVRSAQAERLQALQSPAWPADGIAVPDNDLRNRDPLAARKGIGGFVQWLLAWRVAPNEGARDNADLEAFDRLPKLPIELDPLAPRAPKRVLTAQDLDGVFGLAALFSASDVRLLEIAVNYSPLSMSLAVDVADPKLFEPAPFQRVRTLNALLVAAGKRPLQYCCLDVSEMSLPLSAAAPRVEIAAGSPLKHFEDFCFACHRGNPARRLDFMSGDTEAEVRARIEAQTSIRDALDWERYKGTDKAALLMPPADSEEHARLQAALAQNPKLLEDMRAVVPGLFDF